MDVSAIGVRNTASYLPRSQVGLQGPYSAARQQDTTAQVLAQAPIQQIQQVQQVQAQQQQPLTSSPPGRGSIGQILDISV